jgi:hypothetical protein
VPNNFHAFRVGLDPAGVMDNRGAQAQGRVGDLIESVTAHAVASG